MDNTDIEKIETVISVASNGQFDKTVNKMISEGWVISSKISYFDSETQILGTVALAKMKVPKKEMTM